MSTRHALARVDGTAHVLRFAFLFSAFIAAGALLGHALAPLFLS
ncbi:hypothetical protein SAMN05518800_1800 [Variovorax sp. YR752]|nr:hypothetical protein [Variovorax sp. YR752]SOD25221.1 hypothetical protein SAMN05518800_1800 [Variovorax sp. YR752]